MNNKYKKEKREHETTMEALKKWEDMDYEDLTLLANELYVGFIDFDINMARTRFS